MEEYKNNFIVSHIDGRDDSVEFVNGIKIYAGDVIGKVSEDQLRRIQIREMSIPGRNPSPVRPEEIVLPVLRKSRFRFLGNRSFTL